MGRCRTKHPRASSAGAGPGVGVVAELQTSVVESGGGVPSRTDVRAGGQGLAVALSPMYR